MIKLLLVMPLLLMSTYASESDLRCWTCSSNDNPNCNDPYMKDPNSLGVFNLEICITNYFDAVPYLATSKPVFGDQLVTTRGCTWKRRDDESNNCPKSPNKPNQVVQFCETCDNEGCNGASATTVTLALIMTPLVFFLLE